MRLRGRLEDADHLELYSSEVQQPPRPQPTTKSRQWPTERLAGPQCPWAAFQQRAVEFHLRNATAWANEATGQDLAAQVDPDFQHGPAALAAHA